MTAALFAEVESNEFSAHLGFASSREQFVQCLSNEPAYEQLFSEVVSGAIGSDAIVARIQVAGAADFDRAYRNPLDTAVAAYLWLLVACNAVPRDILISTLDRSANIPNLYWGVAIAEYARERLKNSKTSVASAVSTAATATLMLSIRLETEGFAQLAKAATVSTRSHAANTSTIPAPVINNAAGRRFDLVNRAGVQVAKAA